MKAFDRVDSVVCPELNEKSAAVEVSRLHWMFGIGASCGRPRHECHADFDAEPAEDVFQMLLNGARAN